MEEQEEMMGWQWHQLDHMPIICTSLQTDNHISTSSLNFYGPDALPATQRRRSTEGKYASNIITKNPKVIWEEPCRWSAFSLDITFLKNVPSPIGIWTQCRPVTWFFGAHLTHHPKRHLDQVSRFSGTI